MKWELDDGRPIWPQLKDIMAKAIIMGEFPLGGSFPTVRDLAEDAGVNRNTMQRALAELETEGLLITNRTAGRTVTTDEKLVAHMRNVVAKNCVENFCTEMKSLGFTAEQAAKMIIDKGEDTDDNK